MRARDFGTTQKQIWDFLRSVSVPFGSMRFEPKFEIPDEDMTSHVCNLQLMKT